MAWRFEGAPADANWVRVPGGLWRAGVLVRDFQLRPAGDTDAEFLLDSRGAPPAARANALLATCMGDEAEHVEALTVGDREALLLHLRRISQGEDLTCRVTCPARACQTTAEIELRVSDLLVPPYACVPATHVLTQDNHRVEFRLPSAGDLAVVAGARTSPDTAAAQILERCVLAASCAGEPLAASGLPAALVTSVAQAMASLDPQAELTLEWTCEACGAPAAVILDVGGYFLSELDHRAADLAREVHILARHYHWHERDILRMSRTRRGVYLELCAAARPSV